MPNDCRYMRTRLQIEYSRLLDWCEITEFIEYEEGQDLPDALKADRFVLVAILTEIRTSMEELADVNGKYTELKPEEEAAKKKEILDIELVEEFSNIVLSYERRSNERKYPRGINHIARSTAMAKNIARRPKRLKWVAFDRDVFKKLLGRLTELNDHLQELMHGYKARELQIATQRTYLEMVQVRASVDELKHLVAAAMLLPEHGSLEPSSSRARRRNEEALASLARFKSLNATNEAPSGQKASPYAGATGSTYLTYSQIYYDDANAPSNFPQNRARTEGKLYPGDGSENQIWIEWKSYKTRYSHRQSKHVPMKENTKRVRELVALLQSEKPQEFCTPKCVGFFDDRDDSDQSQHDPRFGLVFEKPINKSTPISLHQLIGGSKKPSLTIRMKLAHKISTCILYLHAVNWLHKALRSDSILFLSDGTTDSTTIRNPYLTGYEYARPDKDGETLTSTTNGDVNLCWELYVHPNYQGAAAKGTYRKTFDIYSLGIVLLEIAHWKHIETLVNIDPETADFEDLKGIRANLLRKEGGVLETLRGEMGERYFDAARVCVEGRTAFGVSEMENEMGLEAGAKLQNGFARMVVERLEGIVL
ncbi:hypothetical protein MMC21_001771 [Puttea exsequens]|nr:hypothetical protein [Puttea exsequens]